MSLNLWLRRFVFRHRHKETQYNGLVKKYRRITSVDVGSLVSKLYTKVHCCPLCAGQSYSDTMTVPEHSEGINL